MKEIVAVLGKEAYNALGPDDRQVLALFIWGGYCMHKDLNSFKGGNTEMMLEWPKLRIPAPILFANKENTALLRHVFDPAQPQDAVLTEDQFQVFQASTRGGVKACVLAGAIFNNKDDKKGQGDKHVKFMSAELRTQHRRFPDTSNTCFGSHGDTTTELVTHLPLYKKIVDLVKWTKQFPSLTNIEKNLQGALCNI
jgi:hypothetical protein